MRTSAIVTEMMKVQAERQSDGVGLATSKSEDEPFYVPVINVNPQYFHCWNDVNIQSVNISSCTLLSNF